MGVLNHATRRHSDTDSDSSNFEENPIDVGAPQHAARTAGIFNPVARWLNFGQIYSDTDEAEEEEEEEEAAAEAVVEQAVDVHRAEDAQPESPALIDWERFDNNEEADSDRMRSEQHGSLLMIGA